MSEKLFSFWCGMEFISSYGQTGCGAHTASHSIAISSPFLGMRHWGVKFDTHLHLVQRLRMGIRMLSASRGTLCLLTDKNFGNDLGLNMAYNNSRLQFLSWRTFVWGYRECILEEAWCVVQEILVKNSSSFNSGNINFHSVCVAFT